MNLLNRARSSTTPVIVGLAMAATVLVFDLSLPHAIALTLEPVGSREGRRKPRPSRRPSIGQIVGNGGAQSHRS